MLSVLGNQVMALMSGMCCTRVNLAAECDIGWACRKGIAGDYYGCHSRAVKSFPGLPEISRNVANFSLENLVGFIILMMR